MLCVFLYRENEPRLGIHKDQAVSDFNYEL